MQFIEYSNLPEGPVSLCAVDSRHRQVADALSCHGIECIEIDPHPALQEPVSGHADLSLCHLGGNLAVVAQGREALAGKLQHKGFRITVCEAPLQTEYPNDVLLNCALIRTACFANPAVIDKNITNYCNRQNVNILTVKQGYTKCSTCIVDANALITSDPSIAEVARRHGFAVLSISPGHIQLPGYDTGFIGGCTGLLDIKTLAFTGSLKNHPDGERIISFLRQRSVSYLELLEGELLDIGSIIPLMVDKHTKKRIK